MLFLYFLYLRTSFQSSRPRTVGSFLRGNWDTAATFIWVNGTCILQVSACVQTEQIEHFQVNLFPKSPVCQFPLAGDDGLKCVRLENKGKRAAVTQKYLFSQKSKLLRWQDITFLFLQLTGYVVSSYHKKLPKM